MTLNHLNMLEKHLEDENQLLHGRVKQLECKIPVLTGKRTQINLIQQVRALSLTKGTPSNWIPMALIILERRIKKKNVNLQLQWN